MFETWPSGIKGGAGFIRICRPADSTGLKCQSFIKPHKIMSADSYIRESADIINKFLNCRSLRRSFASFPSIYEAVLFRTAPFKNALS